MFYFIYKVWEAESIGVDIYYVKGLNAKQGFQKDQQKLYFDL